MRALTLWQPWAYAVADLGKRLENRTWTPPALLVGERFAIHAGARLDRAAMELLELKRDQLVFGAIVATAVYAKHVDHVDQVTEGQRQWWRGPLAWVLEDVHVLHTPVPTRGWQKLWTLSLPVERAVRAAAFDVVA
jgi:hypothetical protein